MLLDHEVRYNETLETMKWFKYNKSWTIDEWDLHLHGQGDTYYGFYDICSSYQENSPLLQNIRNPMHPLEAISRDMDKGEYSQRQMDGIDFLRHCLLA